MRFNFSLLTPNSSLNMRNLLLTLLLMASAAAAPAQVVVGNSARTTVYPQFRPADITMADGRKVREPAANIFMKNGSLVFKRGSLSLKAHMPDIAAVDFGSDHYLRVDSVLAQVLDTVGAAKLLAVSLIDVEAYRNKVVNARKITNIDVGEQISTATLDDPDEEGTYPVVCHFYYLIDGRTVRCHERSLRRLLDKEQLRRMRTYMSMPDFTWGSRTYLVKILQLIVNK